MKIREIVKKDNPAIEKIIKRSLESFGLDIPGTAYFDPQLASLSAYYQELPNSKYWVITDEHGVVMGGVGIAPFGKHAGVCELQKLYIMSEAQGQGLSKQLMETALRFAMEHYSHCYLETMEKLQVANRLYERLGFRKLDRPLDGSEHGTMDTWYIKEL
ncbi:MULTISPECIES: GNAT family N-acetyltransferase [Bhargavaea]|uniref:GNAT family N-acetyltransferase n=1 Tax=Bhargavaea changchunensis TaxID=2134037 RepID=A0ABW2ND67_9BACL|nr:GNAT family N-acetyltransferase [Bhargavaea sp. CC-171006]